MISEHNLTICNCHIFLFKIELVTDIQYITAKTVSLPILMMRNNLIHQFILIYMIIMCRDMSKSVFFERIMGNMVV